MIVGWSRMSFDFDSPPPMLYAIWQVLFVELWMPCDHCRSFLRRCVLSTNASSWFPLLLLCSEYRISEALSSVSTVVIMFPGCPFYFHIDFYFTPCVSAASYYYYLSLLLLLLLRTVVRRSSSHRMMWAQYRWRFFAYECFHKGVLCGHTGRTVSRRVTGSGTAAASSFAISRRLAYV